MKQSLLVKLTPTQFLLPHSDRNPLLIAAGLLTSLLRRTPGLPWTQGADAQRRTQIGGANNSWEIAIRLVAIQGSVAEAVELLDRRRLARPARAKVHANKAMARLV